MRFFYLLFIFFNLSIVSQKSNSVSPDFNAEHCIGSRLADDICGKIVGEQKDLKGNGTDLTLDGKKVPNSQLSKPAGPGKAGPVNYQGRKVGDIDPNGTITFNSFSTPVIPVSGDIDPVKASGNCEAQKEETNSCCTDPVNCLGGEHLSTFNQVNNIATQVGPGMSMLLQGTGKDMSGMCEALQAMAGAGAGLSTAAFAKCKSSISACHSSCDQSIKSNCEVYVQAKLDCQSTNPLSTGNFARAETNANKIVRHSKVIKPACTALNAKAGEIANNLGQMANSAISAELCKQQASATKGKEECAKAGGRWDGYNCITPEGECEKIDGVWDGKKCKSQQQLCQEKGSDWRWNNVECVNRITECEELQKKGGAYTWDPLAKLGEGACREVTQATVNTGNEGGDLTNPYGGGDTLNTETPGGNDGNDNPDNPDNNDVGGGGSPALSGSGSNGLLSGLKSSDTDSKKTPTNKAAATAGSGKSYGGGGKMRGTGRRSPYGRRSAERTPSGNSKDKSGLSMGGGGFSGYGGGGGSNGEDSYASLGLSKKKLKELKKKAGAKRKAAGEGLGGAHQNIFERITKRFQSLCKNKLDCR